MEIKSDTETLIRAPVIIKNKKMITLELFKPLHSPFIVKWFENPNNWLYQNTKRINKKTAKELIKSDCNKKVYLIKNNNKPIGYCMTKDIKTNPKVGITIDEPYWGNGYGKEVMKILEKKAILIPTLNQKEQIYLSKLHQGHDKWRFSSLDELSKISIQ